jgi:hypothetical protein
MGAANGIGSQVVLDASFDYRLAMRSSRFRLRAQRDKAMPKPLFLTLYGPAFCHRQHLSIGGSGSAHLHRRLDDLKPFANVPRLVSRDHVESAQFGAGVMMMPADQVEDRQAFVVGHDRFAVDHA